MNQRAAWGRELLLVGLSLLAAILAGWFFDAGCWPVLVALSGWLVWHLLNLWRLSVALRGRLSRLPQDTPGIWGYIYDRMSLRLRKEGARKRNIKRLLREALNIAKALPDPTIVLNRELEIQWLNKAARQTFQLKMRDVGTPITDLVRLPAFCTWLAERSPQKPLEMELPRKPPVILFLRLVPYGGKQFLLLARDLTERYRLDQMRQDFIANASHELRTPLTVFQGSLEDLMDKLRDNQETQQPLRWMQRQSDRMQAILADLLTLSRLEHQTNPQNAMLPADMNELIESVYGDARILSTKLGGHQLRLKLDEKLDILGEYEPLQILISNLITNAVRYTPAGGSIEVNWFRDSNGACFQVSDTGPGIAQQHIARLTERFYRVDTSRSRAVGGTGLGLAIVKHVLESYGADLNIVSKVGVGSTFSFVIPDEYIVAA